MAIAVAAAPALCQCTALPAAGAIAPTTEAPSDHACCSNSPEPSVPAPSHPHDPNCQHCYTIGLASALPDAHAQTMAFDLWALAAPVLASVATASLVQVLTPHLGGPAPPPLLADLVHTFCMLTN